MPHLTFTAHGTPAPQGSKLRTRFGLIDDNAKTLKPWRRIVTDAARAAHDGAPPFTDVVTIGIDIRLTRPQGHYRTGRNAHLLRDNAPRFPIARGNGDLDKYARAICDSITTAGVWGDDVQVIALHATKQYADTTHPTGVTVTIIGADL